MEKNESKSLALMQFINRMHVITGAEIPDIDLYMDQVTTFMDTKLADYKRAADDKILTKAMINNYTKSKILSIPNKKKYTAGQLKMLIALYHMKTVMSLDDIGKLLKSGDFTDNDFYDMFAALQMETMRNLSEEVAIKIKKAKETSVSSNDGYDEKSVLLLLAISLIIEAGANKRLAEKIIDTYI